MFAFQGVRIDFHDGTSHSSKVSTALRLPCWVLHWQQLLRHQKMPRDNFPLFLIPKSSEVFFWYVPLHISIYIYIYTT